MSGLNRAYKRRPSMVAMNGGPVLCLDAGSKLSYPGTGTTWTDLSGNANNGTLVNGPTFSSANGGSIVFNGTSNYGQTSNLIIPATGAFSVGMFYNLSGPGRGGLFERNFNSPYNGMSFGQGGNSNWAFNILSYANSANELSVTVTYPNLNTWYYDVGVFNGTDTVLFYRNGQNIGSTTGVNQGNLNTQGTRTPLLLFYRGDSYLPGKLSNVQIYNRALSATEVATNFELLRGRYGI